MNGALSTDCGGSIINGINVGSNRDASDHRVISPDLSVICVSSSLPPLSSNVSSLFKYEGLSSSDHRQHHQQQHHLRTENDNNAMWQSAADDCSVPTDSSSKLAGNGTTSSQTAMDLDGTDRISAVQNAVLTAISELERLQNGGVPTKAIIIQDPRYLELTKDKPVKLQVRILVPVKDHPKFNFVGKLLGPKGNSLKRLQEDTLTKMAILGRGSMRDKAKEAELRQLNDPKFAHLSEELHVEISTFAPPAEAYARISHAMAEIKRFLVPDYNDDIRQDQLRELAYINGNAVPAPLPQPPLPPLHRRPGCPPPPPLVAASARTTRVGLLATPSGRALAARAGAVPPATRSLLRPAPGTRAAAYRAAVVPDARLRAEEGYVYDDGYAYQSTYDDGDPYYEYTPGGAAIDPYPEDFGAGEDWRINNDSLRLKASRPAARTSFRDHPYAPPSASTVTSVAGATSRF